MKNDHIDIFDLIDEVAKKNNASHVVKFLKQNLLKFLTIILN